MNCLAFANDIAILSNYVETVKIQIDLANEIAEQTGLQMFCDKTKVMTNIKGASPKR